MTDVRTSQLSMFTGVPMSLEEAIIDHIDYQIAHFQSAAILVHCAVQNVHRVRAAIVRYVARRDNLSHLDPDAYSSYEIALQELYLRNTIILRLVQKERYHKDFTYSSLDVSGFNKVFFDHEQNASDDDGYYRDVSN